MTLAEKEIPVSELDTKALEAAARAICEIDCDDPWGDLIDSERAHLRWISRAAVSAYLDSLIEQKAAIFDAALERALTAQEPRT